MAAGENKTDAISVDKTLRTNGGELTLDASSHSQVRLGRSYQDVLYEGIVQFYNLFDNKSWQKCKVNHFYCIVQFKVCKNFVL